MLYCIGEGPCANPFLKKNANKLQKEPSPIVLETDNYEDRFKDFLLLEMHLQLVFYSYMRICCCCVVVLRLG